MELNLKFDEQSLTKICNKILDEYEYNGKTIREWADRISNPKTNADRIRSMSNEELADWLGVYCNAQKAHEVGKPCVSGIGSCEECWIDWLKQECD